MSFLHNFSYQTMALVGDIPWGSDFGEWWQRFLSNDVLNPIFRESTQSLAIICGEIYNACNNVARGFFHAALNFISINGGQSSQSNATIFALGIGPIISDIAIALATLIVIYGFIVENLDFHTYDGWDRVIRFLIRLCVIVPLVQGFKFDGKIFMYVRQIVNNFNKVLLTGHQGTWDVSNIEHFYFPSFTNTISMDNYDAITSAIHASSFYVGISTGIWNGILIDVFAPAIAKLVYIIIFAFLGFITIKKGVKLFTMVFPYAVELKIMCMFFPIAIAFFGSHSTQHVAQSYLRRFFAVSLTGAMYVLVALTFTLFHSATDVSLILNSIVADGGLGIFSTIAGSMDDIWGISTTLLRLSILEQLWTKADQYAGHVYGV